MYIACLVSFTFFFKNADILHIKLRKLAGGHHGFEEIRPPEIPLSQLGPLQNVQRSSKTVNYYCTAEYRSVQNKQTFKLDTW
jgi:hypothetical protein